MKFKHFLILFLINLIVLMAMASMQPVPGYMDAEYYYAGAMRLFEGKGFTEEIIWNYLDNPTGIPRPSHTYWMPLVSLLGATGMVLVRGDSYLGGRLILFLIALCLPLGVAAWSYRLTKSRNQAMISALLAVLSAFYLPYLTHTDSFALVMILGLGYFACLASIEQQAHKNQALFLAFGLGLLSGLMHLSRADGIIWLAMGILYLLIGLGGLRKSLTIAAICAALSGYLLVMGPWFWRNYQLFQTPLAPGNFRALWLTSYEALYTYPADSLNPQRWLASGWGEILQSRLWALGLNLQTIAAVQGEIFLLPFILLGLWSWRKKKFIKAAVTLWGVLLAMMTLVFPFAGARGGFFHSGAALQPLFWAAAPVGLERALVWAARVRRWNLEQARRVFQPALVMMAILLSVLVLFGNSTDQRSGLLAWGSKHALYQQIEQELQAWGADPGDTIMVNNPPGFYVAARRPAISIPFADLATVLTVAQRYQARYLLLEFNQLPGEMDVYANPFLSLQLKYLGSVGEGKVYEFVLQEQ